MNRLYSCILVLAGLCMIAGSCTQQQGAMPPVIEMLPFNDELVLSVPATTLRLFEQDSFKLRVDNDTVVSGIGYYLGVRLDSVRWEIPDIIDNMYSGIRMPVTHVQNFYLPGKYIATVTGYRDGTPVSDDTTAVEVRLDGDFLGVDWVEDTELTLRTFRFTSQLQGFSLDLLYRITDKPYMLLSYNVNNYKGRDKYKEQLAASRSFLSDYITKLYGKSEASYEGDDVTKTTLEDDYAANFKNPLDSAATGNVLYYPLAIWKTPGSHVALIGSAPLDSGEISATFYKLIAEPL